MENHNVLHNTMTGFRKDVCTQDTMLRICEDVYEITSTLQLRTIAAVDIPKAFDTVTHR